ncbi:MAG: DUF4405 domain-containing protein [Polyangia bacterium]|jgi:hypothetical protein|nr:DUF4405 domain-containing protein [Polyangia bacterium]
MKRLRSWVTPITIGSFLLLAVTGLLLFFKMRGGLIVVAHEWLSPIFVVGAGLHIWLNWGAVRANLSRARGIIIVGLFAALLLFSITPGKEIAERAREHDWKHGHVQEVIGRKAAGVLLQARISTVAELTGRSPQHLRDSLALHGVRVTSDDMTLADAARQSKVSPVRVLDAVLQEKK